MVNHPEIKILEFNRNKMESGQESDNGRLKLHTASKTRLLDMAQLTSLVITLTSRNSIELVRTK